MVYNPGVLVGFLTLFPGLLLPLLYGTLIDTIAFVDHLYDSSRFSTVEVTKNDDIYPLFFIYNAVSYQEPFEPASIHEVRSCLMASLLHECGYFVSITK